MLGARQALPYSSMGRAMTNNLPQPFKLFHFLRAIDEDLALLSQPDDDPKAVPRLNTA